MFHFLLWFMLVILSAISLCSQVSFTAIKIFRMIPKYAFYRPWLASSLGITLFLKLYYLFLWVVQLPYAVVSQRNTILPHIYCNESSSFSLFLSDGAIPSPAIRSNLWIYISSVASSDKKTLGLYI